MKLSLKTLLLVTVLASVLVFGISVALADLPQPDGRINQVHHFGGDALYCVDENKNPTSQYSDFGKGGLRLLNQDGQELWFLPSAVIDEVAAQSEASNQMLLVAEDTGSYGPTSLYVFMAEEGGITFIFSGYDEHGKQNSITFKFCEPVGPAVEPTKAPISVDEPELPEETETPTETPEVPEETETPTETPEVPEETETPGPQETEVPRA